MLLEDIALTLTPALGAKRIIGLLDHFSTSENVFRATREELIHFAYLSPVAADSIARRATFSQAEREVEYCRKNSISILTPSDDSYPPLLKMVNDYPHVLYAVGDVRPLAGRTISMVGTRRLTSYGDRMCHELVRDLSALVPDLCIVSGLAFGVDSASHRAALDHNVPTVAVIASPLPQVTPAQHTSLAADIVDRGGAILSECHSQTRYHNSLYASRNRIIAALSSATLLVESPTSGGSMQTATIADGYNRAVMAVPGRVTDPNSAGCNKLIRNKVADILLSADQVVRTLMWDCDAPADRVVTKALKMNLNEKQLSLLKCFNSDGPTSIEELCERSPYGVSEISVLLFELEMNCVVRMLHGNRCELLDVVVTQ